MNSINATANTGTTEWNMFRHFLSNEMADEIHHFAKIHRYDDRIAFKEAWTEWTKADDIEPLINEEIKRMRNMGYTSDIVKKMFVSARYYHRNAPDQDGHDQDGHDQDGHNEDEQNNPKIGGLSKEILRKMDEHISQTKTEKKPPQDQFNEFCIGHRDSIEKEIARLKAKCPQDKLDPTEVLLKFKKSYKNRYYTARKTPVP